MPVRRPAAEPALVDVPRPAGGSATSRRASARSGGRPVPRLAGLLAAAVIALAGCRSAPPADDGPATARTASAPPAWDVAGPVPDDPPPPAAVAPAPSPDADDPAADAVPADDDEPREADGAPADDDADDDAAAEGRGATGPSADELMVEELAAGDGPEAGGDDLVVLRLEGRLADGTVFDPDTGPRGPWPLDALVEGLAEGIRGMTVGGRRRIVIPPRLGYGAEPVVGPEGDTLVPADATLTYEIELLELPSEPRGDAAADRDERDGGGAEEEEDDDDGDDTEEDAA